MAKIKYEIKFVLKVLKNFKRPVKFLLRYLLKNPITKIELKKLILYVPNRKSSVRGITVKLDYKKAYELDNPSVVLDIGANYGAFSLTVAQKFPNLKILSYEPEDKNFEFLSKNIQENNLEKRVFPHKKGVLDKNGSVILNVKEGSGVSSIIPSENLKDKKEIQTLTLKKIIENNNLQKVDLMKMDVEGAEFKIILSSDKNTLRKIKKIYLEYHENKDNKKDDIIKKLEDCNFETRICREATDSSGIIYAKLR